MGFSRAALNNGFPQSGMHSTRAALYQDYAPRGVKSMKNVFFREPHTTVEGLHSTRPALDGGVGHYEQECDSLGELDSTRVALYTVHSTEGASKFSDSTVSIRSGKKYNI